MDQKTAPKVPRTSEATEALIAIFQFAADGRNVNVWKGSRERCQCFPWADETRGAQSPSDLGRRASASRTSWCNEYCASFASPRPPLLAGIVSAAAGGVNPPDCRFRDRFAVPARSPRPLLLLGLRTRPSTALLLLLLLLSGSQQSQGQLLIPRSATSAHRNQPTLTLIDTAMAQVQAIVAQVPGMLRDFRVSSKLEAHGMRTGDSSRHGWTQRRASNAS